MEVVITGKGIDVTPALRAFTENKLKKLERLIRAIIDVQVILSVQKYLQIAELTVKSSNGGFSARAQTTDMYASINESVDSLLKQARRQSRRIKSHKGRQRPNRTDVWEEPAHSGDTGQIQGGEPHLRRERVSVKPMSLQEATLQVRSSDDGFIVFRNAATNALTIIHRRADGELGIVEPEL